MSDRPVRARRPSKVTKKAIAKKSTTTTRRARATPRPPEVSVGTDAAFAAGTGHQRRRLKNISEVRHFFRTNDVPILFFGATRSTCSASTGGSEISRTSPIYDAWDGAHPRVFTPADKPYREFESGEEINNWLLCNAEVRAHIDAATPRGVRQPRSRWCSSTARPKTSAGSWATT